MKPEFSEILLPPVRVSQGSNSYTDTRSSNSGKWLAICAVVFALAVTIITTVIVVRYEDRFSHYERRLIVLEEELTEFYKKFIDDGHSDILLSDYDTFLEDEDEEPEMFGEVHLEEPTPSRNKRQIAVTASPFFPANVPRTSDGVPILEESYADRAKVGSPSRISTFQTPPPTTESEGLRLYEGLVTTGGRNEPKSLDFSSDPSLDPILPHHRTSAAWSEKTDSRQRLQVRSGDTSSSTGGPSFSDNIFYTKSTSRRPSTSGSTHETSGTGAGSSASYRSSGTYSSHQQQHITNLGNNYSPHSSTVHRASRVPNTGDQLYPQNNRARTYQYPPLKKLGQGDGEVVARVLQSENEADSEVPNHATATANFGETATSHAESSRRRHNGYRRHNPVSSTAGGRRNRQQHRNKQEDESDEISIVKAEAWVEGPKTLAAHFVADVSNYTTGHRHYAGNGRLRNMDGIFSSWVPSDWMAGTEMSKAFTMSASGVLTVKNTGLYYIYAQIHYLDDHDIQSFVVQVNTEPFLQCTTMTETQGGGSKSNSCFTSGIKLLKENDRILIKDIETNRYSVFKPEKSFFGLMRIGDTVR